MTVPAIKAVGFCPHPSKQGDWAFEYALELARSEGLQLDILLFLVDPFAPHREPPPPPGRERTQLAIAVERRARLYFDDKVGDYLRVGCRVCEADEWHELHRCLSRHEFQVLVLPCPAPGALFATVPIEQFANALACPVVLVGPSARDEFRLNGPAALRADRLRVDPEPAPPPRPGPAWTRVGEDSALDDARRAAVSPAGRTTSVAR